MDDEVVKVEEDEERESQFVGKKSRAGEEVVGD